MAKEISIIVCVGNEKHTPEERGDPVYEALQCYRELADELIVIDGSRKRKKYSIADKVIQYPWPYEWNWAELPKHLTKGYALADGRWVLRCDIDYIFHQDDIEKVRDALKHARNWDVVTFQKFSYSYNGRFYQKGEVPLAINKGKVGDTIQFGSASNKQTDLCYPIYADRQREGVWHGEYNDKTFLKSGIRFYNYDATFRTEEFQKEEFWRFSKAYHRYFNKWPFGETKEEAFMKFLSMMRGRYDKSPYRMLEHPKYIKERIDNLTEKEFGYDGWGSTIRKG